MALVSHGTSACASSIFAPPTTNKIGAMGAVGAMVPAYFSMTAKCRSISISSVHTVDGRSTAIIFIDIRNSDWTKVVIRETIQ